MRNAVVDSAWHRNHRRTGICTRAGGSVGFEINIKRAGSVHFGVMRKIMFDATVDNIESDQVTRYSLTCDGRSLTFSDVLDLWQSDADFRHYYTSLLAASPFAAYRWETPALTKSSASQPYQFVLLNCPGFCARKTDRTTYGSYFTADDTDYGIVSFANLSGDATLIVPSPRTEIDAYGHLAAFIRHAPKPQLDAFWRVVGTSVKARIGPDPLWLSTAGGGVAWLHVRLDPRPKYYGYSPYKSRLSKP